MKPTFRGVLFVCLLLLTKFSTIAQQVLPTDTTSLQNGKRIELVQALRYNFQDKGDTIGKLISLAGNAIAKQEKTIIYADSIVLNQKLNILEAYGHVHINDNDSIHTYADYLRYIGKEKKAFLRKKVKLTDGKGVLTTDNLDYDLNTRIGSYSNNGKLVNGQTVLTSKEGFYNGFTKDVVFKKKVKLVDPEFKINTDTLYYNLSSEVTSFHTPTTIINKKKIINTTEGWYNLKSKEAWFGSRSTVTDTAYYMVADSMYFNDITGIGEMKGQAVYVNKEKEKGFKLSGNYIYVNKKTGLFWATDSALVAFKKNNDSLFLTADTLYSSKITQLKQPIVPQLKDSSKLPALSDTNVNRYFMGYHHVKFYSDSMQAICDSLFFSAQDSVLRMFYKPIVWNNSNQLSGDTIYLFMKNEKPDLLQVKEQSLMINNLQNGYFNQVAGTITQAFFDSGQIKYSITKGGPATNVYYAEDDTKKLIGVNKSTSDIIEIYFNPIKQTPEKVILKQNLSGTLFPMNQINHEEIKVQNFSWQTNLRPKNKFIASSIKYKKL